jgi:hypothetical protein
VFLNLALFLLALAGEGGSDVALWHGLIDYLYKNVKRHSGMQLMDISRVLTNILVIDNI